MKLSFKQRKSPKGPEIYIWDYSKRRGNNGFGVIIVEDCTCYLLHFNKKWEGVDDFLAFDMSRKEVDFLRYNNPFFKFHCELR